MPDVEPGYGCKRESAWHTWQTAGAAWKAATPNATTAETHAAASAFAAEPGWPDAGRHARFRAFLECAI